MRRLATYALCLLAGVAVAGPEDVANEQAGAARVEKALRAQGLVPGKQSPPDEYGEWGIEVLGTPDEPRFIERNCVPPEPVSPSFAGKRFSYEARNRGEWGGQFALRDRGGRPRALLDENIVALIPSGSDLYVFSGLDHGMDEGGVHVVEDFDSRPRFRSISKLPGTPLAIGRTDDHVGGFLVVTRYSLTRVFGGHSIEVLMARHAPLYHANSVLAVGRSQILIGLCGGVAQVQLPWYVPIPGTARDIPVVTYWTRVKQPESR